MLYEPGVADADARAAIAAAGGTVRSSNTRLGYAVAESAAGDFTLRAERSSLLVGAARNRSIGTSPSARPKRFDVEQLRGERVRTAPITESAEAHTGEEPLAPRQWDMRQIDATSSGSYAKHRGSKKVMVGIIDTGVDGKHPDIAPNFSGPLSRNFTRDMRDIDNGADEDEDGIGDEPCEHAGCKDPANVDDNGHGTHVAGTIGAPLNGVGIGGVAPNVTLVNIRAGQDSGYFFLQPTLDALTYAGDIGLDVVNMSFYVDPWLFNCRNNPADSEAEQAEQRTARTAVQRAVTYARSQGVLPIAAAGNGATDLGKPEIDESSPDYPAGAAKTRKVNNNCIVVPSETNGVVTVTSTGRTTRKAYYSDYGIEHADIAAPGGDYYDTKSGDGAPGNLVLAAYPKHLAQKYGEIDDQGRPTTDFVVRSCSDGACSYYQYLQGTSMASPHAAGVAALIVSKHGSADYDSDHRAGLRLPPYQTQGLLAGSAVDHACPAIGKYVYNRNTSAGPVKTVHFCEGTQDRNGFYGEGIVNALTAVTSRR